MSWGRARRGEYASNNSARGGSVNSAWQGNEQYQHPSVQHQPEQHYRGEQYDRGFGLAVARNNQNYGNSSQSSRYGGNFENVNRRGLDSYPHASLHNTSTSAYNRPSFHPDQHQQQNAPFSKTGGVMMNTWGDRSTVDGHDVPQRALFSNFSQQPTASSTPRAFTTQQKSLYADLHDKSLEQILNIMHIELLGPDPLNNKPDVFCHNARRIEKLSDGRVVMEAKVQPGKGSDADSTAFVVINQHELVRVVERGVRKALQRARTEAVDILLEKCRIADKAVHDPAAHANTEATDKDDDGNEDAGRGCSSASSSASVDLTNRQQRRAGRLPKSSYGDFISDELGPLQQIDEQSRNLSNHDRTLMRCVVVSTPRLSTQVDVQQFFNHIVQLNLKNGITIAHSSKEVQRPRGADGKVPPGKLHVAQISMNGHVIAVSCPNANQKAAVRQARQMTVAYLENNCTCIEQVEPRSSDCYRLRFEDIHEGTWEQALARQEAEFKLKTECCFDKSHFGRKMLEKMGWKEGATLGVSNVSQFDARDVALRTRMPMAATSMRAALGSVEGKVEEHLGALLDWFNGQAVRNEWKVLQLSGLESRWRKLVHTQALSRALNSASVCTEEDKAGEKTVTVSHKRSIGEIINAARQKSGGLVGWYRVVREAEIKSTEDMEW